MINYREPAGEEMQSQRDFLLSMEYANWIHGLTSWQVYFTGTFRWPASLDSAVRGFKKFMMKQYHECNYFAAFEPFPSGYGWHNHSLIERPGRDIYCKEMWSAWFQRFGRNKVELIRSREDVASYASKYCVKQAIGKGWYEVHVWKPSCQPGALLNFPEGLAGVSK
jgi:hypothetical protein